MIEIITLINDFNKLKISMKKRHLITDYYYIKCNCNYNIFTKLKTCDSITCKNIFRYDKDIFKLKKDSLCKFNSVF